MAVVTRVIEPHEPGCFNGSYCRCGPTVQCPAVLIDIDSDIRRCTERPHNSGLHKSAGRVWDDPRAGVTYTAEGES